MHPINEASRRWEDFQGGRPITLPDNQAWHFYEPEAMTREGRAGWTFGADVAPDVDAVLSERLSRVLYKWKRASTDADRASVMLEAAWFLLARNYNLSAEEFAAIMGRATEHDGAFQRTLGSELRRLVDGACVRAAETLQGVG